MIHDLPPGVAVPPLDAAFDGDEPRGAAAPRIPSAAARRREGFDDLTSDRRARPLAAEDVAPVPGRGLYARRKQRG